MSDDATEDAIEEHEGLDAETIVEDAKDLFAAGDDDPPAPLQPDAPPA